MKKRLYFAIALTVVAALLADVANFNSWFGYSSEGAATVLTTLLYLASWVFLIVEARHFPRALFACFCFWLVAAIMFALTMGDVSDFGAFILPAILLLFITAAPLYGFSQRSVLSLVYVTLGLGTTKYVPSSQLPNLAETPILLCVAVVMLIFIGVVALLERLWKREE